MHRITKYIIFALLCSCASKKVDVRFAKLEIPKMKIDLVDMDVEKINTTDTKEILINYNKNLKIIQLELCRIISHYKNDIEYYNAVIDTFNNENK